MSHPFQREFVSLAARHFPEFFTDRAVLEIGSLNVNGTVRDFFRDCRYVGLDVAPGRDVDVVCEGQNYDGPEASFDTVLSCEAMEHNPAWSETFVNMVRLCRPGGLVLMTCATTGRREHGTTRTQPGDSPSTFAWDYYRNLTRADFERLPLRGMFSDYGFWCNWVAFDLYFCGIKAGGRAHSRAPWLLFETAVSDHVAKVNRTRWYRAIAGRFGEKPFQLVRSLRRRRTRKIEHIDR